MGEGRESLVLHKSLNALWVNLLQGVHLLHGDSTDSFSTAYSAWRTGTTDNPIPNRFLAPIDCLKIPAQNLGVGGGVIKTFWNKKVSLNGKQV
jgi:hypothetical protein